MTFQNVISKVSKWQLDVLVLSFHNCSDKRKDSCVNMPQKETMRQFEILFFHGLSLLLKITIKFQDNVWFLSVKCQNLSLRLGCLG